MAGARRSLRQVRCLERLLVHVLATRARVPWARRTEPPSPSRARRERFPVRTARFPRRRRGRLVPAHASSGLAVSRTGPAFEAGRRFAGGRAKAPALEAYPSDPRKTKNVYTGTLALFLGAGFEI